VLIGDVPFRPKVPTRLMGCEHGISVASLMALRWYMGASHHFGFSYFSAFLEETGSLIPVLFLKFE